MGITKEINRIRSWLKTGKDPLNGTPAKEARAILGEEGAG